MWPQYFVFLPLLLMSIVLLGMPLHLGRHCLLRFSFVVYARLSLLPYVPVFTDSLCSTGQPYILALTLRRPTVWSVTSALECYTSKSEYLGINLMYIGV
ncbi:hypothetical protein BDR03DRAFT_724157 [Suillus americanus]|nr:hypothetical protein BDR03DRAFT_724157 [Suillus americanus]